MRNEACDAWRVTMWFTGWCWHEVSYWWPNIPCRKTVHDTIPVWCVRSNELNCEGYYQATLHVDDWRVIHQWLRRIFHTRSAVWIDFSLLPFRFCLFVHSGNGVSDAVKQSLRSIVSARAKPINLHLDWLNTVYCGGCWCEILLWIGLLVGIVLNRACVTYTCGDDTWDRKCDRALTSCPLSVIQRCITGACVFKDDW